jgi:hypothetical protein
MLNLYRIFDGSGSSGLDLGTAANPGSNTIRGNTVSGLRAKASSSFTINAPGNTWKASQQNADVNGQYAAQLVAGPTSGINHLLEGANVKLQF